MRRFVVFVFLLASLAPSGRINEPQFQRDAFDCLRESWSPVKLAGGPIGGPSIDGPIGGLTMPYSSLLADDDYGRCMESRGHPRLWRLLDSHRSPEDLLRVLRGYQSPWPGPRDE